MLKHGLLSSCFRLHLASPFLVPGKFWGVNSLGAGNNWAAHFGCPFCRCWVVFKSYPNIKNNCWYFISHIYWYPIRVVYCWFIVGIHLRSRLEKPVPKWCVRSALTCFGCSLCLLSNYPTWTDWGLRLGNLHSKRAINWCVPIPRVRYAKSLNLSANGQEA